MKRIALACCLVLAVASVAQAVDVINGCYVKNNGQFRILLPGDTCLPSEKLVSFRSATDTAGLNPEVYDANGQFLGVGQIDELYIPSLRKWTLINLRDASGDVWEGILWYASADCSGEPYAEYDYLHRVFSNGQSGGRKYYTASATLADPPLIVHSYREREGECTPLDFDLNAAFSRAVEIALPFTVPVALPTRIVAPNPGMAGRPRR